MRVEVEAAVLELVRLAVEVLVGRALGPGLVVGRGRDLGGRVGLEFTIAPASRGGDCASRKIGGDVDARICSACGCPFCVRDTNGSYAHPDASAGLADVLWDAPRAFSREGRRFTAHAGVAVAVGGSDDYSLKYDLAFDDDGHPAFVNISHPLWISTAARVDGFTRDVAGDAFDIPRGCFK